MQLLSQFKHLEAINCSSFDKITFPDYYVRCLVDGWTSDG